MELGEKIKFVRQQKKMRQKELADKVGILAKSISTYESNLAKPGADILKKIADGLQVSVDYLLNDDIADNSLKNIELVNRLKELEKMDDKRKNTIISILDVYIRDFKAEKTYSK